MIPTSAFPPELFMVDILLFLTRVGVLLGYFMRGLPFFHSAACVLGFLTLVNDFAYRELDRGFYTTTNKLTRSLHCHGLTFTYFNQTYILVWCEFV